MAMQEPQEVPADDHEQIVHRVASVDVGKEFGKACSRTPHPTVPGRRVTRVWAVRATTNAIMELAAHLATRKPWPTSPAGNCGSSTPP